MIEPVKVVTTDRLLHMMGDTVAVVWNTKTEQRHVMMDGLDFVGSVEVPNGKPYIDFVDVRQDKDDGTFYEDDDSPVAGGMDPKFATKVAKELLLAVEYINQLGQS